MTMAMVIRKNPYLMKALLPKLIIVLLTTGTVNKNPTWKIPEDQKTFKNKKKSIENATCYEEAQKKWAKRRPRAPQNAQEHAKAAPMALGFQIRPSSPQCTGRAGATYARFLLYN